VAVTPPSSRAYPRSQRTACCDPCRCSRSTSRRRPA
jgi:hypothetical protein